MSAREPQSTTLAKLKRLQKRRLERSAADWAEDKRLRRQLEIMLGLSSLGVSGTDIARESA